MFRDIRRLDETPVNNTKTIKSSDLVKIFSYFFS